MWVHFSVNTWIIKLTQWSISCLSRPGLLLTGALSCEEAVPPLAGAALHPSPDDPGHVHPHLTFTGQLSQHQAVHVAMREKSGFVLETCFGTDPRLSLSSCSATSLESTKTLSELCKGWRARERDYVSPLNLRRDIIQTVRGKWMGAAIKDTAAFSKREVSGSKDARDQAEFRSVWLWLNVQHFIFFHVCLPYKFSVVFSCSRAFLEFVPPDCTELDSPPRTLDLLLQGQWLSY